MPYPAGHRERVRQRIVDSARRLFQSQWIYRRLGGFHHGQCGSDSRRILATSAARAICTQRYWDASSPTPNWKSRWEGVEVDSRLSGGRSTDCSRVLVAPAFQRRGELLSNGRLPSDVARSDETVQGGFRDCVQSDGNFSWRDVRNSSRPREDTAMLIATLCIGWHGGGEVE